MINFFVKSAFVQNSIKTIISNFNIYDFCDNIFLDLISNDLQLGMHWE